MLYCSYYQAHIPREKAWFLVAVFRSYEHLAFDRTIDKERSIFEFFVPVDLEHYFLELMHMLQQRGAVGELQKLPNRLKPQSD